MLGYSSVSGVQSHSPYGCRSLSSDHTASPVDQALADIGNVGILHHVSPLDFPGVPHACSHQYISGRMISRGNGFPPVLPLPGTHCVAPPLIFHLYVLFSLPSIGPFEIGDSKNLRNKNHSMQGVSRYRSR